METKQEKNYGIDMVMICHQLVIEPEMSTLHNRVWDTLTALSQIIVNMVRLNARFFDKVLRR